MYQIKLNENNYFSYIMVSGIPSNALKTLYVAAYATAHAKCMGKSTCKMHGQKHIMHVDCISSLWELRGTSMHSMQIIQSDELHCLCDLYNLFKLIMQSMHILWSM